MPQSGARRRTAGAGRPPPQAGLPGSKRAALLTRIEDAPAPHRFNKFVIHGYRKEVRSVLLVLPVVGKGKGRAAQRSRRPPL